MNMCLNLQKMCWHVRVFKSTANLGNHPPSYREGPLIRESQRRCVCLRIVRKGFLLIANLLFELLKSSPLSGTLDELTIRPSIDKAIAEAAATLTRMEAH